MLSVRLVLYVAALCLQNAVFGQVTSTSTSQYFEEGRDGIVDPAGQHSPSSFLVQWHDGDSSDDPIIMTMYTNDFTKVIGYEYIFGEYDIFENGSLWIRHVTSQHDHCFFVQFKNRDYSGSSEKVCKTVIVKPRQPHPVIRLCHQERHCLIMKHNYETVTCAVRKTRPPVQLYWSRKLKTDYTDLSTHNKTDGDYTTITEANATVAFLDMESFQLLRCSATAHVGQLDSLESFVLVENRDRKRREGTFQSLTVELHATLSLPCGPITSLYVVWKINQSTLGFVIDGERMMSGGDVSEGTDNYDITENGALLIPNVSIQHEHRFECTYSNDGVEYEANYQLVVLVKPDVPHPGIDVCQNTRSCFRTVEGNSSIMCSVTDTRPKVNLTWSRKTSEGYREWNYTHGVAELDGRFTTRAATEVTLLKEQSFFLLSCKTTGVVGQFDSQESFLLVEVDDDKRLRNEENEIEHINVTEHTILPCDISDSVFLVWKLKSAGTIGYILLTGSETVVNVSQSSLNTATFRLDKWGSLQIHNLSSERAHQFECIHGDGDREERRHFLVSLHVKPAVSFPVIDVCENAGRTCYKTVEGNSSVMCTVENTNPAVTLTWSRTTAKGYKEWNYTHDVVEQNGTFTSLAETTVTLNKEKSFFLLRCETSGIFGQFDLHESFVLVEVNNYEQFEVEDDIVININVTEYLSLACGSSDSIFVVWKLKSAGMIGYVLLMGKDTMVNISESLDPSVYKLQDNGSLEIYGLSSYSELQLECIHGDGDREERRHFLIALHVDPSTPKPVPDQIYRLLVLLLMVVPTLFIVRICTRAGRGYRLTQMFNMNTNGRRETILYICRADDLPPNPTIEAYSKLFTHVIFDDRRRLLEHLNRCQEKDPAAMTVLCLLCNYNMKFDAKELSEYLENHSQYTIDVLVSVLRPETRIGEITIQKKATIIVVLFDGNNPKFEAQERAFVEQTKKILNDFT